MSGEKVNQKGGTTRNDKKKWDNGLNHQTGMVASDKRIRLGGDENRQAVCNDCVQRNEGASRRFLMSLNKLILVGKMTARSKGEKQPEKPSGSSP